MADIASFDPRWNFIDFYYDLAPPSPGVRQIRKNWTYCGSVDDLVENSRHYSAAFVAMGNNAKRLEYCSVILKTSMDLATVVHPMSSVSQDATLDKGVVVVAGAVVNGGARVGTATIVNSGATVDHDCILGRGVHISPGAHLGGGVDVGDETWIGIGASVRELIGIGRSVVVGAGAVVVKGLPDGATAFGNPARIVDRRWATTTGVATVPALATN